MWNKGLLLALSLLAAPSALAWDHAADVGSLKETLETNDFTLVAFIHPTDEQSQLLEPEWVSLQSKDPTHITSIDCSASSSTITLCSSLDISSFPTIRLYHPSGHLSRYRGPRRAPSILSFLRRMLRPPLSTVTSQNTTAFLSTDDVLFIGHFGSSEEDTTLRERFTKLAQKYRDRLSFALAGEGAGQDGKAMISCYNMPDELQRSITEELDHPLAMEQFVKICATPLIPELTRRNEVGYYKSGKSLVHYFVQNGKERTAYVSEMLPLAKKYSEYLQFTTTDINEYPDAMEMMGVRRGLRGPSVQNPSNGDVYPYTGKQRLSAHVMEMFLSDIIQGKVQPLQRQYSSEHEEL